VNTIDDSHLAGCTSEACFCVDTGGVGTAIALGAAAAVNNEGEDVADAFDALLTSGDGGTGTGMGLISNFSGSIGLPSLCEIAFANRGIVSKMTTKASAKDNKAMRIQWIRWVVFIGTLLMNR